jgi:tetratricopeptide (TPR) repeat protein
MSKALQILKAATACCAATFLSSAALAQEDPLDPLFEALKQSEPPGSTEIENRIWEEWSKSGSASMDLLLQRGREALEAGEIDLAIEHFSALVDHAPDFAEAYNSRATAYFQDGEYGLALEDIRRTLALNPRHFGAMSGLAMILEEMGREDGALEAWRAVEALNPSREGVGEAIERLERQVEGVTL